MILSREKPSAAVILAPPFGISQISMDALLGEALMSRWIVLSILLLFLLAIVNPGSAQTSSITGTVTDVSGAVVPHAKVFATDKSTSVVRSTDSNDSGTYRITNLPPGTYDVLIEKAGFKFAEYSGIQLTVDQVQTLDAKLAPSAVAEKVTVVGKTLAPVDLNDSQIGNVVSRQQLEALPLILRDPYQLTLLSPGAIPSN